MLDVRFMIKQFDELYHLKIFFLNNIIYNNSLSLTNTRDGTFNNLYLINDDGEVENVKDLFSQTNTRFTGNIGINLTNIDTNDSALFVKGARIANPSTTGIRFGTSNG